jgi:hypothetical protein
MDVGKEFKAARAVGTPLIGIRTSNQPDLIRRLATDAAPEFRWDAVKGVVPLNDTAKKLLPSLLGDAQQEFTIDPVTALDIMSKAPDRACLYVVNAHRFVDDAKVATAVGNLREPYKSRGATCVLLGPSLRLPQELVTDVILLEDALPDDEQLKQIVEFTHSEAGAQKPSREGEDAAVTALRGLSSFGAEQQAFLSLRSRNGALTLDMDSLWARKTEAVNAIPGLFMEYKKGDDAGIRGLKALRGYLDRLFREENEERPMACLHVDEVEKALAGSGAGGGPGDSSGVTQDQIGQLLQTMEEKAWDGLILVGPPGTGKSMIARSAASIYGVPYLRLDLGALKGSLVGQSEQQVRMALDTIDRASGGRLLVLATCNRMEVLPPELRRRFCSGIWYFDLPSDDERRDIWALYAGRYNVKAAGAVPWSKGWTGAEIRNACRTAWRLGCSIDEAAKMIVPVCQSAKEEIERLRRNATGRFIDASKGEAYLPQDEAAAASGRRRVAIEE